MKQNVEKVDLDTLENNGFHCNDCDIMFLSNNNPKFRPIKEY